MAQTLSLNYTFCLIAPKTVSRGEGYRLISDITNKGFKIISLVQKALCIHDVRALFPEETVAKLYPGISKTSVALLLEKNYAVADLRRLSGDIPSCHMGLVEKYRPKSLPVVTGDDIVMYSAVSAEDAYKKSKVLFPLGLVDSCFLTNKELPSDGNTPNKD